MTDTVSGGTLVSTFVDDAIHAIIPDAVSGGTFVDDAIIPDSVSGGTLVDDAAVPDAVSGGTLVDDDVVLDGAFGGFCDAKVLRWPCTFSTAGTNN